MASKLLHTLADENSDLQKKIGCMNGIFQIFDRHHILKSRRKSLTLGGNSDVDSINFERDSEFQFQDSTRASIESSRVSFSSSCSSFSPFSYELNREAQPEISAYDRVIFPESPTSDPVMSQGSGFAKHMGLDLRDVIKDSMYGEARGVSEVCRHRRREESPRPYGLKQSTPVNFDESCKALAKLKKTSQHCYNEVDKLKSGKKLKEFPRLSVESRDQFDLRSCNKLSESSSRSSSMNKVSSSPKRPPSVVAKLMGLDTLPGSPLNREKINMFDDTSDLFSRSLREHSLNRTILCSPSSPRSLAKDPASYSPRWRSSEFIMKPLSSLRFPTEPAPWKQACKPVKALSQSMEERLKDVEFKHSGKNLRAIKEILQAMQSQRVFHIRKQPQCSNLEPRSDIKMGDSATTNQDSRGLMPTTLRGPIVIMKPARLVEISGIPSSSLLPIHSLSGLNTTCREESINVKRISTRKKAAKDRSSGIHRADSGISSVDNKSSTRIVRSSQVSKESNPKNSGTASSRLHHMKKHEGDKLSRPSTTPSDSSKSRRQTTRQPEESTTSPGGRSRTRAQKSSQKNDGQLLHKSNKSKTETKVTMNIKQATEAKSPSVTEAAKTVVSNLIRNKFSPKFSEDGSSEHPSPVSVLNASIYREIKPSSTKMQPQGSGNGLIDSGDENCQEDQWNPAYSFSETTTNLSPEINRKKLQNVEHLVQQLKKLNSSHDETSQDYIALLSENNDPNTDHKYISEILLASGFLLRDLSSELTTLQLHPSGHPINPELFHVLEQTKENNSRSSNEKLKRKLVFDSVNEMLIKKLVFVEGSTDTWMNRAKAAMKRVLSAQQLLKELCSEIETVQKQAKRRADNLLLIDGQEEDFLKCILDEEIALQFEKWTDFDDVIPGVVLDLERLLFKDLVSEIVHGEIGRLQQTSGR